MSAYTDAPPSSTSINQFIRKIVLMCDEHNAKWGTPQALAGFVLALDTNKHLAMDFWSIVARMSEQDSGVGPEQVLEVIVEGVTGRSVAEVIVTGKVERRAVDDLTRLLAGEDIWSPEREGLRVSNKVEIDESSSAAKDRMGVRRTEKFSSDRLANEKDVQVTKETNGGRKFSTEAVRPFAATPSPASHENVAPSPRQYFEPSPDELREDRRRLFLEPEPVAAPEIPIPQRSSVSEQEPVRRYEAPIRIPLAAYEETGKSRRMVVIALLLVLSVGGVAAVRRGYGLAYWQGFEATVHDAWSRVVEGANAGTGVDRSAIANAPIANSPVDGSAATGGNEGEVSGADGAHDVSAVPTPAPAPEIGSKAAETRTIERRSHEQGEQADRAARQRTDRGETEVGENSLSVERAGSVGRLVEVPAGVMQARLLSSRVPTYPAAARADHIEGRVVMQAIVTKEGAVVHLHVASGNPSLRAAAMEAVSAWRYRPYMVNGEPVDVLTKVSVDFLVDK